MKNKISLESMADAEEFLAKIFINMEKDYGKRVITVGKLQEKLKKFDKNLPICLEVYRHTWHSKDNLMSHGNAEILKRNINGSKCVLIRVGSREQ